MSRHVLLTALGCAVPMGVVFALPYLPLTKSTLALLLLTAILCPTLPLLLAARRWHGGSQGVQPTTVPQAGSGGSDGPSGAEPVAAAGARSQVDPPAPPARDRQGRAAADTA